MAFCRVVFPLLVLSIVSSYASFVPVYIWGDLVKDSLVSYPLLKYNSDELRMTLKHSLTEDTLIVVFVEETLSVEDFSLKNDNGETSLPYLHGNLNNAIYLPSVNNSLKAINKIADPELTETINLTEDGISEDITPEICAKSKFIIINLKDAREGETRSEMLLRHDEFMQNTISKILEWEDLNVVAVYTAHYPSWTIPQTHSRTKRAAASRGSTYAVSGLRLYSNSIQLISGNNSTPLSDLTASHSEFNGTTMNTSMTFDNTSIILNFHQKGGYWFFDSVQLALPSLTEDLYANEEVFAIMGFSYRCMQHVSFSSINETSSYTLSFQDIKIQPFFEATNSSQAFGDSFNCVGFFSAPIWAALFVVFILLLITFYGIMMMMDIRTMDRFDDPKGKTITINSE